MEKNGTNKHRLRSPTGSSLHPLEKLVYQELKALREKLENQNVVVAVSGGIDSVVLLHVLVAIKSRLKYKLHVVHINHGVRGPESDADSKFVGELAEILTVPLTRKKLSKFNKSPSENTLREGRYRLLFEVAKKIRAPFVITAHHQDDLLETRLMRLLQGTGVMGLRAMTILSDDGILRPFIHLTRRDVENYARAKNLDWRNDATNFDTTKFRNWIRRNWIGALRREHPHYIKTLSASLERIIQTAIAQNRGAFKPAVDRTFNRSVVVQGNLKDPTLDEKVYSYLRYHGKKRVTNRLVDEFKKRVSSPRKKFTFRLAGVNWTVNLSSVEPS